MKISRIFVISTFVLLATVFSFGQRLVVDPTFTPSINGAVNIMKVLPDQKIMIAGYFKMIDGQTRSSIARLNADGTLDPTFNANLSTRTGLTDQVDIRSMTVQPDGKILIAGRIFSNSDIYVERVLRLNSDGSPDPTLTTIPQADFDGVVFDAQQMPNGKILVGGYFTSANGNARANIIRYNSNGSFDPTFNVVLNEECSDIVLQPDGKYVIAGWFSAVNGIPQTGLTRFNTDDSIDTSFNAPNNLPGNSQKRFNRIYLQNDGSMYGVYSHATGNFIYHLNADGSIRKQFDTQIATGYWKGDMKTQPNGKTLVAGEFRDYSSTNSVSEDFNRFMPDGSHDGSLDRWFFTTNGGPPLDYPVTAKSIEITAEGKILVGGQYTSLLNTYSNQTFSRQFLARFIEQPVQIKPKFDFDGDGKDDLTVFRPSNGVWYVNHSTSGFYAAQFGISTDIPVVADYDGDGRADIAVFRNGAWYWLRSSNGTFSYGSTGQAGDIPQPSFNVYGLAGLLVFRPSEAAFYIQPPYSNPQMLNLRGMPVTPQDIPVVADYDGDRNSDLAVFRDGNWFYLSSDDQRVRHFQWGQAGDKPVIGDFDADGRTDYAIFRPSTGGWWIQKSTEGFYAVQWGLADDLPVPADYDGDGKTDIAVYRPSNGVWYIMKSTGSYHFEQYGLSGDIPAQLKY